jgi:DNA repair protein RadD
MLVDEAHLVSHLEDTEYQAIIKKLRSVNSNMKVIGFTATPYRLGQGLISDGPIFTDVCYDLTGFEAFNRLVDDGYLSPLIPKRMHTVLDISKVKITAGEYNQAQLQAAVDIDATTLSACEEMIEQGFDRKCWLVFGSGVKHAEHVSNMLNSLNITSTFVHSKMSAKEATRRLEDWKAGKYRAMVNYGKLTTGIDHPAIDLIGVLRPTTSTALWVQILGRATRVCVGKINGLVLDFARNTERLGPINDPVIPRKRVKGQTPGVAPIRICPACGVYNHARATFCFSCLAEFPHNTKLAGEAGMLEVLRRIEPVIGTFDVQRVVYNRLIVRDSPPMIKVSYFCGLQMFNKILCFDHEGYAGKKAREWWRYMTSNVDTPPSTEDALKYITGIAAPKRIRVLTNRKYPEVLGYEF